MNKRAQGLSMSTIIIAAISLLVLVILAAILLRGTSEFAESTSICVFKYRTYMNNIAISNHLLVNLLQTQNVKRETVKKIDTDNAGKKISNDTSHIDTSPIDTLPIDTPNVHNKK